MIFVRFKRFRNDAVKYYKELFWGTTSMAPSENIFNMALIVFIYKEFTY